ncbi:hypothetical protein [Acinetobacter bereziniae]|uniref:hypothetical protein n=2 Tax=Acinetobacter bereziniae TaxID=106648 RepID=UPI00125EC8F3|nr:hypothetical protein [Acinetobacter bereziniae]MBJ8552674.1 hypothetical protein [Acinetobacter bereziniae]
MKIYMSDIRNAKMCARGTRAFFILHGLDFQDFLKNGIDAEKILNTKDAMAIQVVELKYGRQ